MNQAQATHTENDPGKTADRPSRIILSAVVSLVALVAVISHWQAFHWWSKLDAIVFVFILAATTVSEIFAGKPALGRFRLSLVGYTIILLAIILFASD